nr:MAG TPA: hypothetical protein [Caudoviricetes sp.]
MLYCSYNLNCYFINFDIENVVNKNEIYERNTLETNKLFFC